nr:hypothetical protein Iba_chr15cCG3250 [Ipomoea batatas]
MESVEVVAETPLGNQESIGCPAHQADQEEVITETPSALPADPVAVVSSPASAGPVDHPPVRSYLETESCPTCPKPGDQDDSALAVAVEMATTTHGNGATVANSRSHLRRVHLLRDIFRPVVPSDGVRHPRSFLSRRFSGLLHHPAAGNSSLRRRGGGGVPAPHSDGDPVGDELGGGERESHVVVDRISGGGTPATRFVSSLGLPLSRSAETSIGALSAYGVAPGMTSSLNGDSLSACRQNSIH